MFSRFIFFLYHLIYRFKPTSIPPQNLPKLSIKVFSPKKRASPKKRSSPKNKNVVPKDEELQLCDVSIFMVTFSSDFSSTQLFTVINI